MKHLIEKVTARDFNNRAINFQIRIENDSDVCVILDGYVGSDNKIRITGMPKDCANEVPALLQALAYFTTHEQYMVQQIQDTTKAIIVMKALGKL